VGERRDQASDEAEASVSLTGDGSAMRACCELSVGLDWADTRLARATGKH
jgi:hypothetical protein